MRLSYPTKKGDMFPRLERGIVPINIVVSGVSLGFPALGDVIDRDTTVSVLEPDEIRNVIVEVVDLVRHINIEVDSNDLHKLLDSQNQELTIDVLMEMHEQEQGIEEHESIDPV
ncbi:hypothetical protein TNCV_669001 [Trichonephila clavipes]|nr:hypothetical protein TNCV_669001 [Trichonephila clavipes]